jgi:uncharacterized phage protein gp47/JayE
VALTQQQISLQMLAQLRVLDPSVSGEVGTPERKILDTVGQSLAENQIDLDALSNSLNVDTKYGATLDRFLSIFGFSRQKATYATGFVSFSRNTPANVDIRIPAGVQLQAALPAIPNLGQDYPQQVQFLTLYDGIIPAGATESDQIPIRAAIAGVFGNVAANYINQIIGSSAVYGVTSVTNAVATNGGKNAEDDDEYKVRFRNTIFRNLAGTQDQYMALAIATAFTSRANVVGPQSSYREYIQVPAGDDTTAGGGGNAGEYSSALSTLPFAKYVYKTEQPVFISSRDIGPDMVFYRQDVDYRVDLTAAEKNRGDAKRLFTAGTGPDPTSAAYANNPSITFTNVYTGTNADVTAIRPSDLVLLEYSYLSSASRNDVALGIFNAVDVYIDGGNDTSASTVVSRPTIATAFVDDPSSKYYYENYRRVGEPEKRPLIDNILLPLFWQPSYDVPDQIVVGTNTYFNGVHYWPIEDVSVLAGTIRARNGIEWSTRIKGKLSGDPLGNPSSYTGQVITDNGGDPVGGMPIEIDGYTYDKNIVDLQAALTGSRQITTDVLAHKAKKRYFKLDITVMYSSNASIADVNLVISSTLQTYFQGLYFGAPVQLSDLLQIIHNIPGVDNVRWTADIPNPPTTVRVFETDKNGQPLAGASADRVQPGDASTSEVQRVYITGAPTGGIVTVSWPGKTITFSPSASVATIQGNFDAVWGAGVAAIFEDIRPTIGVRVPVRSLVIGWNSFGAQPAPTAYASFTTGPYVLDYDFFLHDDEQASLALATYVPPSGIADTVPGLIIRPKAQNTWTGG